MRTTSKEQVARYGRQLLLPELGVSGQRKLLDASVLIIGAGGLGSPAALYLAAAGVGRLGIIDSDCVELSNLHRQILHTIQHLGRPKSRSAQETIQRLNPDVAVEAIQERLSPVNARALIRTYDLVLDGSDNVPTRYLANDACVLEDRPFIYGGAIGFGGQVMVVAPRRSACLRCVFAEPPSVGAMPSCQTAGVLGAAVGVIGSLMALEAIKQLAGVGERLTDRLFVFEGLTSRAREVAVRRDPACAVCGERPVIQQLPQHLCEASFNVTGGCEWPGNKLR